MLGLGQIRATDCQRHTRRSMLQLGACTALGLSLPEFLAAQALGAGKTSRVKSVLLLWLWGGPSHHEMWDPKPDAPAPIRGAFGAIPTATPGVAFSELLPQLSARANRYTLIRSLCHDQKDHNVGGTIGLTGHLFGAKASGGIPFPGNVRPSFGSLVSYLRRAETGAWPAFTVIGPVCKVSGENLRGQTSGILGAAYDPFRLEGFTFDDGVKVPPSLEPIGEVGDSRMQFRRSLLGQLDAQQRQFEAAIESARYTDFQQKAFSLVTSPAAKGALHLEKEPDSLRDRYGRTVFGQNLILGRRLVEAGVPFVQINWSGDAEDEQQGGDGGWDLHYRLFERMHERYCPIFDRALSALLDDLRDRRLLDSTLVLAMGEFGRSPQISSLSGREHWPYVYSAFLAGGGLPEGMVLGSSTADGGYPKTRPVHPANLIATVLEKLGLDRLALGERDAAIIEPPIPEFV